MIKASNLSKSYSGDYVFTNVNFTLSTPQVIGLIGDNGSGKTTLLRILAKEIEDYDGLVNSEGET